MDFNSVLLIVGIIAAIVGAVTGFWLGFSRFKNKSPEAAIGVGFLAAALGAAAGFFLSILVAALLILVVLLWLIKVSLE